MPVIRVNASTPIPRDAQVELKQAFGQAISAVPGKSEQWLMCQFEENVPTFFAGNDSEPAAYIEVSVFAHSEVPTTAWEALTEQITPVVSRTLGIDPARIYINYSASANFGWNGGNF